MAILTKLVAGCAALYLLVVPLLYSTAAASPTSGDIVTIEGKVLDSSTRQPIAGARVIYVRMDGRTVMSGGVFDVEPKSADGQDPNATEMAVLTDMGGNFRFRVNGPVQFQVRADYVGYVTSRPERLEADASLDPITIELAPESTISGRVIDVDTGEPVRGIGVGVNRTRIPKGFIPFLGRPSTTDADGRFQIEGLRPGDYQIQVAPRRGAQLGERTDDPDFRDRESFNYGRYWYPGVEDRKQAGIVTVVPGAAIEGIDIPVAKIRTAAIRGRIFGGDEAPDAGEVSVSLYSIQRVRNSRAFAIVARGRFKVGAGFQIDNLLPGFYWVLTQSRPENPADRLWASRIFEVHGENLDDVDLILRKGVTVTGQVRMEDREEFPGQPALPVDEMQVDLRPPLRAGIYGAGTGPVHAKDGTFFLEGIMLDEYQVLLRGLPEGFKVSEVRYNNSVAPYGLSTLNPEANVHRLEVTLAPAPGSVSVTVTDGTRPVSGAMVLLVPDPANEAAVDHALSRAETDADGRGTVTGLLPGIYRAIATSDDDWGADPMLAQRLRRGQEIHVAETGVTFVQLRVEARR